MVTLFELFNLHRGKPCIPTIHSYNVNLMTRYTTLAHHLAIYIVLSEFEPYFLRTYLPSFLFSLVPSSQFLMANITWYFNSCLLWLMYIPFESNSHILSLIEPAHSIEVFRIWLIVLRLKLQADPRSDVNWWSCLIWIWHKLDLRNTWSVKAIKILLLSSTSFRSFYTSFLVLRASRTLFNSHTPTSHGIYSSVLLFIMVLARGPAHLVLALLMLLAVFLHFCVWELQTYFLKRAREVSSNDPFISHALNCWTGSRRPTRRDLSDFIRKAVCASFKEEPRRSESDSILLEMIGIIIFLGPCRTLSQFWNDRTAEVSNPDYSSDDDFQRDKYAGSEAFGVVGLASLIEGISDGSYSFKPSARSFWLIVLSELSHDGYKGGFKRKAQWASRVSLRDLTETRLKNLCMGLRSIGPRSSWYNGFVYHLTESYSPIHERVEAAVNVFLGFKYGVAISYRHENTIFDSCARIEYLLRNPVPCVPVNRVIANSIAPQNIEVVWADVFSKRVREVEKIQGPWVRIGLEPYSYFDVLRQPRIPDGEKRLWLALECRLPRCSFPRQHLSQMSVFLSFYLSGRFLFLRAYEQENVVSDVVLVSRIGHDLYLRSRMNDASADIFFLDEDIFGSNVTIHKGGSRSVIFSSREEIERAKEVASDLIERGIYRRYNRRLSSFQLTYSARQPVFIHVGEEEEESQIVLLGRFTRVEYRIRCESNADWNQLEVNEPRFLLSYCPEQERLDSFESNVRTNTILPV